MVSPGGGRERVGVSVVGVVFGVIGAVVEWEIDGTGPVLRPALSVSLVHSSLQSSATLQGRARGTFSQTLTASRGYRLGLDHRKSTIARGSSQGALQSTLD